jgi:hypothetical protein
VNTGGFRARTTPRQGTHRTEVTEVTEATEGWALKLVGEHRGRGGELEGKLNGARMLPRTPKRRDGRTFPSEAGKIYTRKCRNGGYSAHMYSDENAEDAARKKTQAFDPSPVDEEGIHPKQAAQEPESVLLKQDQRDEEMDEEPSRSEGWQTFQTP